MRPKSRRQSAVLVVVHVPERTELDVTRSLAELEQLLRGLGVDVIARIVQKRSAPSVSYIGEGKLKEVAALTGGTGEVARGPDSKPERSDRADDIIVVVDDELSPAQQRNLESATGVDVTDRTSVILRVFEKRANSRASRMEVELARLEHELPRVRDDHSLGDREGGGGRASRGASNVELRKQEIRARILAIKAELEQRDDVARRARAERDDVFRVGLVGYTNAGKSSLMRMLTGSDVFVEDALFATLDTTVRQLHPPSTPPISCLDTVGFMRRLPHSAFNAFRSTFRESVNAGLLLHVVDASDEAFREHIAVTERMLDDLESRPTTWLALNKIDRVDPDACAALSEEFPDAIQLSALDVEDGRRLRERIERFFDEQLVSADVDVPYAKMEVVAAIRAECRVVREEFGERGVVVSVRCTERALGRIRKRLG